MNKTPDFSKLPEGKCVVDEIMRRYNKGVLNIIKVIGLSGTGKSYVCMRAGQLVSEEIHRINTIGSECIVDNLLDLLKLIRKVTKPGKIVIIEEASVLFGSRRSMSAENVDANKIFDTMRKKRMIVFLNFPISKSIDTHINSMCTLQLETLKILKQQKVCVVKPLILQTNPASGKTYYHRPRSINNREVHRTFFREPPKEVCEDYEEAKDKFLDELYEILQARQQKKKDKQLKELGKSIKRQVIKPLTPLEMTVHTRVNINNDQKSHVARDLGIVPSRVTAILKNIERKTKLYQENEDISRKQASETS